MRYRNKFSDFVLKKLIQNFVFGDKTTHPYHYRAIIQILELDTSIPIIGLRQST